MDAPPNLLLLVAACAAKAAIQALPRRRRHRPHQRRGSGSSTSSSGAWSDTCSDAGYSVHSHQLDDVGSSDLAADALPTSWYSSPAQLLSAPHHMLTSASALLSSATASLASDVMLLLLTLVRCQWTLRWLLAVQANAAEAFVADFDLFGRWSPASASAVAATAAAAAAAAVPKVHSINPAIAGSWSLTKGWDLVDNQPSASDLLRLGGMARTGMRMFKGMEYALHQDSLFMAALTKLPWLPRVSPEEYRFDGAVSCHNRRDMRKGKSLGYIKILADGGVDVYNKWEEPVTGCCIDELRMVGTDTLRVTTHLRVGAQTGAYCVEYSRNTAVQRGKRGGKVSPSASASALPHVPSLPRGVDHQLVF